MKIKYFQQKLVFFKEKYIYVIHQTGGPYWEKLCPRSWIPPSAYGLRLRAVHKTEGTVFPNTDRPWLVNNIFIFF